MWIIGVDCQPEFLGVECPELGDTVVPLSVQHGVNVLQVTDFVTVCSMV